MTKHNLPPHAATVLAAVLTLGLLLVSSVTAHAQDATARGERVDRLLAAYSGEDAPGAAVAVVRNGEIAFQRAYGMANLTHGIPYTVETVTNIGSSSKQFTAFAIRLLEVRGMLSINDDVRSYIPELPDFRETVTLRHLLTHTSGYREVVNALSVGGWRVFAGDYMDPSEYLTVVKLQPALQNRPGAEYNYNNTGYGLLAIVAERVTGEPFPDWMRTNVFEPLGMKATRIRTHPREVVPNSAQGYRPDGNGGFREAHDLGAAPGAGAIYTTLGDLARWMRNFRTAELGGRALRERMTTRNVLTSGDTSSYAMGLFVEESRSLRVVHHGGNDAGHHSAFIYYPELDAGLIVHSNDAGFDRTIPARIAEIFFGEHMTPIEDPAVVWAPEDEDHAASDPRSLDVLAGRYELDARPGFVLALWRQGNRLIGQASGTGPFELRPTSDSTFVLVGSTDGLTFHRDETGRVRGLTFHRNGDHPAQRLRGEERDLSVYVGRYYSAEFETFYTVKVEDGRLVLRHRRRPPTTLTHFQGDEFGGSFPLLRVDFERDAGGTVTGFRVSNVRARDILFERRR